MQDIITTYLIPYRLYLYSVGIVLFVTIRLLYQNERMRAKYITHSLFAENKTVKRHVHSRYVHATPRGRDFYQDVASRVWLNAKYVKRTDDNERELYHDRNEKRNHRNRDGRTKQSV